MADAVHVARVQGGKPGGWVGRWWPAIAWAVLISIFSTATFTAENTGRVIIPVLHWIFPAFSPETLALAHYIIRKCAHFTEYFVLSLLILRGIRDGRAGIRLGWALLAIVLVLGYASLDEFHQRFVPGRTPAVTDVLIDTAGGALAQALVAFLSVLVDRQEARPGEG